MNIATVTKKDPQRTIISLVGPDGFSVEVRYEPLQHSLRVLHAGAQRLFFYEPDDFFSSKTSLLNEYGLVVGRLQWRNGTKGALLFDDTRIAFVHNRAESCVTFNHPAFPEGLRWDYTSLNDGGNPDIFRALLLILAWSVNVATLQV